MIARFTSQILERRFSKFDQHFGSGNREAFSGANQEWHTRPAHKGSSLVSEADAQKCINREGGVAHPGVAVVPVASAPDDFRQTRGWRCNDRAPLASIWISWVCRP